MDEAELQKNALAKASESANYEDRVDLLLEATLALDNQRWEHVFHSAVLSNGFEGAFIRVVFPFMEKLGILWIGGSLTPVHEHFASALVLRKLQVAIDGQLPRPKPDQPRFLLFLPEGEWHEIGLLFLHYLLRDRGAESFYLGSSLPINDVRSLLDEQDFDYVCLALSVMPARPELLQWLNELSTTFPNQDVIVLGRRVQDFDISEVDRVRLLTQTQEILGFVDFV
jgi:methanogenic corrinoid protein MtbC1